MAIDMFLKIDGIDGESADEVHKGEIDVLRLVVGSIEQRQRAHAVAAAAPER